ncbi:hypothetical protein H2241_23630 [Pantoea ananatis]|uniref:hypothetical protein n=1 Tax=Pantoea ananas TaxID=553 RepID=UPI0015885D2C|nr:hypothetical protein [Pantoea ananatis]MBA4823898.1 hypothetical protein [Pantoea ananatis]QKV86046.1 hypothetical protein FOB88_02365 [Pantoea ananatis]
MSGTKMKTISGRVERVVHVATINDVNLMLYGILLAGEPEWLRICTTRIEHAEKIAFLSPDAHVEIRVRDDINIRGTTYREFHSLS